MFPSTYSQLVVGLFKTDENSCMVLNSTPEILPTYPPIMFLILIPHVGQFVRPSGTGSMAFLPSVYASKQEPKNTAASIQVSGYQNQLST